MTSVSVIPLAALFPFTFLFSARAGASEQLTHWVVALTDLARACAEEEAWTAIQRGDLGNFYEGVDEQGRRFVIDAEGNIGYETLDPMGKPNADSLDGYVVTADGSFFYEK